MKRFFIFSFLIFLCHGFVHSQVRPVRWADLENRFANGKDTLYVVNLWATWCAPCVKELPYFDRLPSRIASRPVKVILVSMDFLSQLQSAVIPFVQKQKIRAEVRIIDEPDQQTFIDQVDKNWSGAIPVTIIFDSKGNKKYFYEKEFSQQELSLSIDNILK